MNTFPSISIVIPTFMRESVLIQTINELLNLQYRAEEILIVDQSSSHTDEVHEQLSDFESNGDIRWLKLSKPSIPNAMNIGAINARSDIVLFLDDDILTRSELVLEHAKCYQDSKIHGVAGQVIQSWERELTPEDGSYLDGITSDPDAFMFNSAIACKVRRFIGCNISFMRSELITIGGFDENFSKVAYRYEAESAERFVNSGRVLVFEPKASIKHLKEESGGTRSFGNHLTSIKPSHCVGMYYYYLVVRNQPARWRRFLKSPFTSCATRFHLRHPWYIPITFISHVSGIIWAISLRIQGQKLLTLSQVENSLVGESQHD